MKVFYACASPSFVLGWIHHGVLIPRRKEVSCLEPRSLCPSATQPSRPASPEDDLVFFLLDVVPSINWTWTPSTPPTNWRRAANRPSTPPCSSVCCSTPTASASIPAARSPRPASGTSPSWPSSATTAPISAPSATSARSTWNSWPRCSCRCSKLAAQAGMVRLGNLANFDGSKFTGQASRHKAMSYGYMLKEEERLEARDRGGCWENRPQRPTARRMPSTVPPPRRRIARGVEASGSTRLAVIAAAKLPLEEQGAGRRLEGGTATFLPRKRQSGSVPAGSGGGKEPAPPSDGCPRTMSSAALAIRT